MIRNLSDHAANERTFLAGVRAAIAVMAFGFLVAKFDLFLKIAPRSPVRPGSAGNTVQMPDTGFGGAAGIALTLTGTLMGALAGVRFVRAGRAIEGSRARPERRESGFRAGRLVVALGVALVIYLAHALLAGI